MRLNPFVYFSETDIRFYLLVTIGFVVSAAWALIFGFVIIQVEFGASFLYRSLLFASVILLVPLLIYWNYRRATKKIIKESEMKVFERSKFPEHYGFIEGLYAKLPYTIERPTLMYEPPGKESAVSAFTFGSKKSTYITMTAGMILNEFYDNPDGFESILLHEVGHIKNKDVQKAYLAASIIRSLRLILPALLIIYLAYQIYLTSGLIYYGTAAGYNLSDIISIIRTDNFILIGVFAVFFLIFGAILYVLRNQIIRLREFYADARVLEWKTSPATITKTLEKHSENPQSKFELLTKFHPNARERIQVLKDNSKLFAPGLWAALSMGYLYGFITFELPGISILFLPIEQLATGNIESLITLALLTAITASVIFLFAISSEFHKSILKDIFIEKTRFFSTKTVMNVIKVSMVFSLGFLFSAILSKFETLGGYLDNLAEWVGDLYIYPLSWLAQTFYIGIALFFLVIFASILVKRSFSERAAKKNFAVVSVLASVLWIFNCYVANAIFADMLILLLFTAIFFTGVYLLIKFRDRYLRCPNCNNRLLILSRPQLTCPHCQNRLYSWAIYTF